MRRLGLTFLTIAIALTCASLSYALDTVQQLLLFQQNGVHDGISLDFCANRFYVKAPGTPARIDSFTNLFTFTRASTATFLGSDGLIQTAASGAPRIEYDASGNCLGLLIEGARTNRALWSNDMTNAAWVATTMTTAQTATGPDGVANSATTLTATAGNATSLQAFVEAAVDSDYCAWIKRRTGTGNIDMTEDAGATWVTRSVTSTWTKFCTAHQSFLNPSIGIRIVTNADAVDVWGNQFEAGAFGSSTIPTTTVAVARAADAAKRTPGAEFSATAGTTVATHNLAAGSFATAIIVGFQNSSAEGYIYYNTGSAQQYDGTTVVAANGTPTANVTTKVAASYGPAGQAIVSNTGTFAVATGAFDGSVAASPSFGIGTAGNGTSSPCFCRILRVDYWPTQLDNGFLLQRVQPGPQSALKWPTYAANDNAAARAA